MNTTHLKKFYALYVLCALAAASGLAPGAYASTAVSLVGVGDWTSPSYDPGQGNTSSKLGIGGGVLVSFMLHPAFRLEIGGLYTTRKIDLTDYSSPTTNQYNGVQVPVLFRFSFNRFISLGAGGYYTRFVGNLKSTNDSTGIYSEGSYSDYGLKSDDYGLVGSLAFHIPITYTMDLTLDGRYDYGLANVVSNSSITGFNSEKFRDVQALVGFTFHMMR